MNEINTVLETNDYSIFLNYEGNRGINLANLNQLKKSMKKELLRTPIIVNEKMQIIDGQHRFRACRELNLPITYIIIKNYGLAQIHQLNAIGKKWSFFDYLEGYSKMGKIDYIETKKFIEKFGLGVNESLSILTGLSSISGGNVRSIFFNGNFKIKSLNNAIAIAEKITQLKLFYAGYKRRSFITAMLKVFANKNFNFNIFLQKLNYQSTRLVDCVNSEQYLRLIESIYNYKNKDKIRF